MANCGLEVIRLHLLARPGRSISFHQLGKIEAGEHGEKLVIETRAFSARRTKRYVLKSAGTLDAEYVQSRQAIWTHFQQLGARVIPKLYAVQRESDNSYWLIARDLRRGEEGHMVVSMNNPEVNTAEYRDYVKSMHTEVFETITRDLLAHVGFASGYNREGQIVSDEFFSFGTNVHFFDLPQNPALCHAYIGDLGKEDVIPLAIGDLSDRNYWLYQNFARVAILFAYMFGKALEVPQGHWINRCVPNANAFARLKATEWRRKDFWN